jgi:hypothetical protein
MTMKPELDKYNHLMTLLRKSKPELDSTEEIEREVMRRIKGVRHTAINLSDTIEFLFRWVYIGWVRRSLIAASICLVMLFVYQQGIILKRIEMISRQTIVSDRIKLTAPSDVVEKMLMNYKKLERRFPSKTIIISETDMKDLLESINELQVKYKDLESIIEEDPELKKLVEKKMIENNRTKIIL